ncbi:hypothetical protein [Mycobacterium sp. 3519A]|uniref:hypothetical protein n=1 Tax=Mycobacterium sp. 3519A TaxID=2057184 RepID=UPI00190EC0E3|nr:hypothetical protein [Mycobacterium sp. 3519A]
MTDLRTSTVEAKPITDADTWAVAEFLRRERSLKMSVADWHRYMVTPGHFEQPNHGYLLRENDRVVGAYLALYSERVIDGRRHSICNLGLWCVAPEHRAHGLRLLRSLLRQKGYTFTDLTPNQNVVALNSRVGFTELDTTTAVVPNMPWPFPSKKVRVVDAPDEIDGLLPEKERSIYRDHAATAVHHVVLSSENRACYVMFRRERRKRMRVFASILYVSNPDLFRECASHFYRYLLLRHRICATLAEIRVVKYRPKLAVTVAGWPKMYLSEDLQPAQIDYLYSELVCRSW